MNITLGESVNQVLRLTIVDGARLDIDQITFSANDPSCTPGDSCNDGDACTTNDVYDSSCNCVGTFADSDNDGVCDAEDVCSGFNDNLIGTACNDGEA